jgi:hypothetical protein
MARWLRTPAFWSVVACVAIAAALAGPTVLYCPAGASSCQLGLTHVGSTGDWRYFAALWEATRVSITDFHQFPSWNPYHCGGIVLYQDPQAPFPGPLFLLTFFWLPTAVGIKVWVFAHLLAGLLGARALIADRGGNHAEQVLGAAIMAACGFVAQHTGGGHLSFTPFLFLPLILWSFRRALVDLRYIVVTAGLFALAQIEGATYPVPLMAAAIAIESVARLGSAADRRGLARALPALAVLFVLLAGVRLVPVLHYLREHPRLVPLDDHLTLGEIFSFWTTRNHPRQVAGHPYVWPEYDSYVGVVPVALMLAGVAIALLSRDDDSNGGRRERRIDLVLFAGLIWCALGNIPGPSLFGLLHELPIYASLRVPSRFLGPAMVGFGLLAVGALTMTRSVLARKGVRPRVLRAVLIGEVVLVGGIAAHVTLSNQSVMQQGLDPVLSRARASEAFHQNSAADYGQFPTFPVRGFGTRSCYVPLEWKPADGLADGPGPQAKLSPPEAGKVTSTAARWSPNVLELDVQLDADAVLVVNQNYETGWRSNAGTVGAHLNRDNRFWDVRARPADLPARGAIGLLGVRLPRGTHHIVLQHRPRGLALGAIMTLLGIALAAAVARYATIDRVAAFRRRVHAKLFRSEPES